MRIRKKYNLENHPILPTGLCQFPPHAQPLFIKYLSTKSPYKIIDFVNSYGIGLKELTFIHEDNIVTGHTQNDKALQNTFLILSAKFPSFGILIESAVLFQQTQFFSKQKDIFFNNITRKQNNKNIQKLIDFTKWCLHKEFEESGSLDLAFIRTLLEDFIANISIGKSSNIGLLFLFKEKVEQITKKTILIDKKLIKHKHMLIKDRASYLNKEKDEITGTERIISLYMNAVLQIIDVFYKNYE